METILQFVSSSLEIERLGVGVNWREKLQVMFRLRGAETRFEFVASGIKDRFRPAFAWMLCEHESTTTRAARSAASLHIAVQGPP